MAVTDGAGRGLLCSRDETGGKAMLWIVKILVAVALVSLFVGLANRRVAARRQEA